MRMLLKTLSLLALTMTVTRLAALVVSRRLDEGSEVSDELRRVVCLDGLDFTSRAGGLRRAEVRVIMGGAKIDLRDATLGPSGATVTIENTLGGVALRVRDDWAVSVEETVVGAGETEVHVTPPEQLPDDAPRLRVVVTTRLGGTLIEARS